MKVYGYLRVSGKGQVEGDGFDRQQDTIRIFTEMHQLETLGFKRDEAVSGTKEGFDRPGFMEMIEAIETSRVNGIEVDGFVVERMDRLARDLIVQELLLKECTVRGIKVFSADCWELMDMASSDIDPTRKLIRQVLGAVAEYAKSETVLKLRKARSRIRRETGRCEGAKAWGSRPGEIQIAHFLKQIDEAGLTWNGKVRMLNDAGFRMRDGREWTREGVRWLTAQIRKGKVTV
jgi:DNA invertase Pin-like site-specific DNA recombinase